MNELKQYYSLRAQEYEQIYRRNDPVRQGEQAALAVAMQEAIKNRRVLEVACGTGFWTHVVAEVAEHVIAVDIAPEMLAISQAKALPPNRVEFHQGDAYALASVPGTCNAGLSCFWFSHIPKSRLAEFLSGLHLRLGTGAIVFLADNVYISSLGGELITRPGSEDTFKLRSLVNGEKYEVLKNYYDAEQLQSILEPRSNELRVHIGDCFWWTSYLVR